ncbi:MAG TPA: OB-fold domain-containing protein [Mycobacteriales bacterium]|nr:OB-fold domain-containing protein [Mycobacteriales bacterium]
MTAQVPVAEGLFTWPSEEPQLMGAKCADCGVTTFPRQATCPRCPSERMNDVLLPRRGTLWTFTTQQFLPKNPPYAGTESAEEFEPYGVGYVELPGEVKVETRLTTADVNTLQIGMEMELVVTPYRHNTAGEEVLTFAFRPVA